MNISVIVPTYERRDLIARALDSVMGQTLPAAEIIVIDDGSTDGTADFVARNFPSVKLLCQPHRGVSAARNHGIRVAAGEWIALLDSDDEWLPHKLERQAAALSGPGPGSNPHPHPNADWKLCHTDEIWMRNGARVNPKAKHAKHGGWIFARCLPLCCISPSSALLHRSVFARVGGFDETLPACEDYDLWLRVAYRYPALLVAQKLVVKHGGHDRQLSRQHWGMDRFRVRALVKMLEMPGLDADAAARVRTTLLDKIAILQNGARKRGNQPLENHYRQLALRWQPQSRPHPQPRAQPRPGARPS